MKPLWLRGAAAAVILALVVVFLVGTVPAAFPGGPIEAENFATKSTGGRGTSSLASAGAYWNIWSNGYIETTASFPDPSTVILGARARGTPFGGVQARMQVTLDGVLVIDRTMTSTFATYDSGPLTLGAGSHVVRVRFMNDASNASEDRNLHADMVQFRAASGATSSSPVSSAVSSSASSSPTVSTAPPPQGSSREAETFAVKTAGGRQASPSASGGALWNLWSNGYIEDTLRGDGASNLGVVARGTSLGGVWPRMTVSVDGVVTGTFTVASTTWTAYSAPPMSSADHRVRIAFTNDAASSTEDRNLLLDVVRAGANNAGSSFTLAAGESHDVAFPWPGGPGSLQAEAATSTTDNRRPLLQVAVDGAFLREAPVAGPVERPFVASFDLPAGTHVARFTATRSTVVVSEARATNRSLPLVVAGADARIHVGGAAQGSAWAFTDYGYLDTPIVVPSTGFYELRVQGAGTMGEVGPLVHLWLNRTVVAEGQQGTTIDLRTTRLLAAGVGYSLGASFENPASASGARFDAISATATLVPPPAPPAPPLVLPPNDPLGWPQYGRDNYNTRNNPDSSMPDAARAASIGLQWRTRLDGSVTSTPAIIDGRVYVGTWNKSFYALNETTGAVVWRTTLPNNVDGSAAVAQGLVVVSDQSAFVAMYASNGTVKWTQTFGGRSWSSPTVDGNDVFLGIGKGEGHVVRVDLQTGTILWTTPTTPIVNSGARVWASPLVPPGSGLVVVGTSPGTTTAQTAFQDALLAFNRSNGQLVWVHQFFPRDTNAEDTPAITVQANRDISGTPHLLVRDGQAWVTASEKHGPVWTVQLADGSLVHGSRLLEPRTPLVGAGGVADGVEVISATDPDRVAGFDVATGDLLWEAPMYSTNFSPVAMAHGLVWSGSWEGHVRAIDLQTGREVRNLDAGGGVLGGVALAHGRIFVGSLDRSADNQYGSSLGKLPGSVSMWG